MNSRLLIAVAIGLVAAFLTYQSVSHVPEPVQVSTSSGFVDLSQVASHSSTSDCWMIIDGQVYDVTSYISVHPGGAVIAQGCGKDATEMFSTKAGAGRDHSDFAKGLLSDFLVGNIKSTGQNNASPQSTSEQEAQPSSAETSPAQITLTMQELALHDKQGDCYLLIDGIVYDVTSYIPIHPGGVAMITRNCGRESTLAFNTKGGEGKTHSSNAQSLLARYKVGALGANASDNAPIQRSALEEQTIETLYPGAVIIDINEEDDGRKEVKIEYEGRILELKYNADGSLEEEDED